MSGISELVVGQLYAAHIEDMWYRSLVKSVVKSDAQPSTSVSLKNFCFYDAVFEVIVNYYFVTIILEFIVYCTFSLTEIVAGES